MSDPLRSAVRVTTFKTETVTSARPTVDVPTFGVRVLSGLDVGASASSVESRLSVGSAPDNTLCLNDPAVSRYHVEFAAVADGVAVRDLGSTNGTEFASARLGEVVVRGDAEFKLGRTRVKLTTGGASTAVGVSASESFGRLIGSSAAMRAVFTVLERAAPTNSPVLVTGESGTGKELAARALHEASSRARGPFEVVDCGGLPPTLIESELFGHERGAFTGAAAERVGAFERADGGTIFLDEMGELPLEVQPKLLRVLSEREVKRVGGNRVRKVDVRVIAATNRELRREVNAGRFRADLFYRLAVIVVRMPPLRDRRDDLALLAPALLAGIGAERGVAGPIVLDANALAELARHDWPGNVRELRNYLEQYTVLQYAPPIVPEEPATVASRRDTVDGLIRLPLREAKAALLERFEREYVTALLVETGGNVSEAARRAGVDRVTLSRTMRRYGLRREEEPG